MGRFPEGGADCAVQADFSVSENLTWWFDYDYDLPTRRRFPLLQEFDILFTIQPRTPTADYILSMKIAIHDYSGHSLQLQLSRSLAGRGYEVAHLYCNSNPTTPKGRIEKSPNDPDTFRVLPVQLPRDIKKTALVDRWYLERLYGQQLVDSIAAFAPDLVISAYAPLDAQARLLTYCKRATVPFVFWVQDIISEAAYRILSHKLPGVGHLIGRYYQRKEMQLLLASRHVVGITEDFRPFFELAGVPASRIDTIPNWAPLDEIEPLPKDNPWSRRFNLADKFVFLYSGALGFKHNPELLLVLAQRFSSRKDVRVVVNSQGDAADWLKQQKLKRGINNLIVNPYQPYEEMSQVLATADVLLAVLEPDAGVFSVPSKVLSYHCAQRPILLAVPEQNLASKIVVDAGSGLVGDPRDLELFCENAERLYRDQAQLPAMGQRARDYAVQNFDIQAITDRFESIIRQVTEQHQMGANA